MAEEQPVSHRWTEQNSQFFIDFGRYFVPDREDQIRTICDLIPYRQQPFRILELCCGEGLLAAALLERFPQCIVHGLDGSPEMLERAKANLAPYGDRFTTETFDLSDRSWRTATRPVRAIVSSLAIHHLDGPRKQVLFRDSYQILEPGGALLISDIVLPTTEPGVAYAAKSWDDAVHQRSLELDGNMQAYDCFREKAWNYYRHPDPIDNPSSLFDQLKWLERAGFAKPDVYWMKAGHAIFGGRKENG